MKVPNTNRDPCSCEVTGDPRDKPKISLPLNPVNPKPYDP